MEKSIIKKRAQEMSSVEDLLALLNELKQDEYGEKAFPIELKKITYYQNPNRPGRYSQFQIPKKSGDYRTISAPAEGLDDILHFLNRVFQALYEPKNCVMGFTENRSVVDNANVHLNQNYVLNLDLKDFFTSVDQARVWKRIQLEPYNIKPRMANTIAGLCSMKVVNEDNETRFVLPQGAPTSPILTNIVCEKLDRRLMGLAKRFGLNYSRYADDMTFSSMHNVYQENGEFMKELNRIISDQGFRINNKKTRLQKRGSRQEVTGLIIGSKANVSQKYIKEIRILLHTWEKFGYQAAQSYFYPRYKEEKIAKKGEPLIENVISGKLMYMRMVKGANDSTYQTLQSRFDKLTNVPGLKQGNKGSNTDLTYFISYLVPEFEKFYDTSLHISKAEPKWKGGAIVSVDCIIKGKKTPVFISQSLLQQVFSPAWEMASKEEKDYFEQMRKLRQEGKELTDIGQDKQNEIISQIRACQKEIGETFIESFASLKASYHITLCQGLNKGKQCRFWLLTDKRPQNILADAKDLTVDKLLDLWENEGFDKAAEVFHNAIFRFNKSQETKAQTSQRSNLIDLLLDMWAKDGMDKAADKFSSIINNEKSDRSSWEEVVLE